jgi:phage host-nuclease inhibitor protein Gam
MPKKLAIAAPDPIPPRDRAEMEDLVKFICEQEIFLDYLRNQMDVEMMEIRDRYENRITAAREEIKRMIELAEDWAIANPAEFAAKKSIAMVHGLVGFRTGMPKLKTLKGWTWDRVLNVLKVAFPEYVRTKDEVAKDLIIDQREVIGEERMRRMGVAVVQTESFYVEPHKEPVT